MISQSVPVPRRTAAFVFIGFSWPQPDGRGGQPSRRAALCLAILRGPGPRVIVAGAQESVRPVVPLPGPERRYVLAMLGLGEPTGAVCSSEL